MKTALHPAVNIFVLLVSIGIVVDSSYQLYQALSLKFNSNTTKGNITGYYTKQGNARFIWNRKPAYAPIFSFINDQGELIEVITTSYKKEMKYKKGDSVTVYYSPKKPKKAKIDGSFPWSRSIVLLIAGLFGVYYTLLPLIKK